MYKHTYDMHIYTHRYLFMLMSFLENFYNNYIINQYVVCIKKYLKKWFHYILYIAFKKWLIY